MLLLFKSYSNVYVHDGGDFNILRRWMTCQGKTNNTQRFPFAIEVSSPDPPREEKGPLGPALPRALGARIACLCSAASRKVKKDIRPEIATKIAPAGL